MWGISEIPVQGKKRIGTLQRHSVRGDVWVEELFLVLQTCPLTDMLLSDRGDRTEDICGRSSLIHEDQVQSLLFVVDAHLCLNQKFPDGTCSFPLPQFTMLFASIHCFVMVSIR
jgi:hypothetical protein